MQVLERVQECPVRILEWFWRFQRAPDIQFGGFVGVLEVPLPLRRVPEGSKWVWKFRGSGVAPGGFESFRDATWACLQDLHLFESI